MLSGNTRRIVVIKDIPSNFIEEAIFILKNDPGTKIEKDVKEEIRAKVKRKQNDCIIKEAEEIINSYIKELKVEQPAFKFQKPGIAKYGKKFLVYTIVNMVLIASIVLLVFVISKVI